MLYAMHKSLFYTTIATRNGVVKDATDEHGDEHHARAEKNC